MTTSTTPIDFIFADDQEIVRTGIRAGFQNDPSINIVAEASNGADLLHLIAQHNPDVVATDIRMPGIPGIEVIARITNDFPGTPVIVLTTYSEDYLIIDALNAGASGYLLKDVRTQEIIEAIKSVYRGTSYYCAETTRRINRLKAANIFNPALKINKPLFSNREMQIILLICRQFSNNGIASELNISIKTVEAFRKKLFAKTGCHNMVGLATYAINLGIYNPSDNQSL